MTKISECMSRDVKVCAPDHTLQQAAQTMQQLDSGVLPVGENDRLVGMITDRDITIRAIAQGKGPETLVRDAMSAEVLYCYDDDDIDAVADNMGEMQVRRMPVVDRDKRLVGIVSLGDISRSAEGRDGTAGKALSGVSEPSGLHSQ